MLSRLPSPDWLTPVNCRVTVNSVLCLTSVLQTAFPFLRLLMSYFFSESRLFLVCEVRKVMPCDIIPIQLPIISWLMYSYSNVLDFSHKKYNSQSILIISSSVDLPTQSFKRSIKVQDFLDPDSLPVSPECWSIHYLNSRDLFSFGSEEIQNRVGIHYLKWIQWGKTC